MTKDEFEKIYNKLRNWRMERVLSCEQQLQGIHANLLEECVEYLRAKNDEEKIDALCDIVVFAMNASEELQFRPIGIVCPQDDEIIKGYFLSEICENIAKIDLTGKAKKINKKLSYIVYNALSIIDYMSYDSYKCMLETIKEISSRTGEYNSDLKKFIKDTGAYTEEEAKKLALLYFKERNFVKCVTYFGWSFVEDTGEEIMTIKDGNGNITHTGGEHFNVIKWYKARYDKCKKKKE